MRSLSSKIKRSLTKGAERAAMLKHQMRLIVRPYPFSKASHNTLQKEAKSSIPLLEKCLTENIAQFWLENGIDDQHGGYRTSFSQTGKPAQTFRKGLVTQARLLWLFSRLSRSCCPRQDYLQAAHHGYEFLAGHFWDCTHQGFVWELDVSGSNIIRADKHLYGQAFALYALSEYVLATRNTDALKHSTVLFELIHEKAYDRQYGGYIEHFDQRWQVPNVATPSLLGANSRDKTTNTHLHLLEAITVYFQATGCAIARQRILELLNILMTTVSQNESRVCFNQFHRDWQLAEAPESQLISYGHTIETLWLVIDACQALDISSEPFLPQMEQAFAYALKYGYDWQQGGFYAAGHLDQVACQRHKIWWVQAEAMVGALYLYVLTHAANYLWVFNRLVDFTDQNLVDWQHGEWHNTITPTGAIAGRKADLWKVGYHNGRAMLVCLERLRAEFENA